MEVGSVLFAITFAAFAFARSFMKSGYYDAEVYGLTAATHRIYGCLGLALGMLVWLTYGIHFEGLAYALTAALAIVAVFYLSSFLRGAHEEP